MFMGSEASSAHPRPNQIGVPPPLGFLGITTDYVGLLQVACFCACLLNIHEKITM